MGIVYLLPVVVVVVVVVAVVAHRYIIHTWLQLFYIDTINHPITKVMQMRKQSLLGRHARLIEVYVRRSGSESDQGALAHREQNVGRGTTTSEWVVCFLKRGL